MRISSLRAFSFPLPSALLLHLPLPSSGTGNCALLYVGHERVLVHKGSQGTPDGGAGPARCGLALPRPARHHCSFSAGLYRQDRRRAGTSLMFCISPRTRRTCSITRKLERNRGELKVPRPGMLRAIAAHFGERTLAATRTHAWEIKCKLRNCLAHGSPGLVYSARTPSLSG